MFPEPPRPANSMADQESLVLFDSQMFSEPPKRKPRKRQRKIPNRCSCGLCHFNADPEGPSETYTLSQIIRTCIVKIIRLCLQESLNTTDGGDDSSTLCEKIKELSNKVSRGEILWSIVCLAYRRGGPCAVNSQTLLEICNILNDIDEAENQLEELKEMEEQLPEKLKAMADITLSRRESVNEFIMS